LANWDLFFKFAAGYHSHTPTNTRANTKSRHHLARHCMPSRSGLGTFPLLATAEAALCPALAMGQSQRERKCVRAGFSVAKHPTAERGPQIISYKL